MQLRSLSKPDEQSQSARQWRRRASWRDHRSESGDTLVELLIAMAVIGLTAVALLSGFSTSLSASAEHRSLASIDTVLKSFVETATYQLSLQPQPPTTTPQFTACATASTYSSLTTPPQNGYTASIAAVQYWNGSSWGASCTANQSPPQPQLLTAQVTGHGATESLQFAVSDPAYAVPQAPVFTSASSVDELSGQEFQFPVSATGGPTLSASGLPTGSSCETPSPCVTFVDNGDGTGTLAGTISVAVGTYAITFTATNSVGSTTQAFTLVVRSAPVITSAPSDTVAPGSAHTFAVTATGSPIPALSASGLPTGVTFADNGGGSGTLTISSGVASGTYDITFTATSPAGTATQAFTLVVSAATIPTFTSVNSVTEPYHTAFTFTVQTTGAPPPTLTSSALPPGVAFHDNGNNTGTLSGTNSVTASSYAITFTATNSAGTATQAFTLVVSAQSTPTITAPTTASPEKVKKNKSSGPFSLTGTDFVNGVTVSGNGPAFAAGAATLTYTYVNSGLILVTVNAGSTSSVFGTFTVTNPDGGTATSQTNSYETT